MSRSRVLCKYFMHGACLKGDSCEFSHNWSDPASNVCTFYQRGHCSYGNRCRYDHVKLENAPLASTPSRVLETASRPRAISSPASKSVTIRSPVTVSNPTPVSSIPVVAVIGVSPNRGSLEANGIGEYLTMQMTSESPESGWQFISERQEDELYSIEQEMEVARLVDDNISEDEPICASAASGRCSHGAACKYLHGDLCPTCGKHCLHPLREEEREEHLRVCAQNRKRLEALLISQDIECTVCLERVLAKPVPAERKFGILSGCDHPFCISCVRGWRSGSHAPGMDIKTVVRACPVCRVVSHYVIPSVTWFATAEEKAEIVNGYKKKLSSLDCRYFDYGNGTCPFGTSCFYKHAFKDGRLEAVKLRHLGAADGTAVIAKDIRYFWKSIIVDNVLFYRGWALSGFKEMKRANADDLPMTPPKKDLQFLQGTPESALLHYLGQIGVLLCNKAPWTAYSGSIRGEESGGIHPLLAPTNEMAQRLNTCCSSAALMSIMEKCGD